MSKTSNYALEHLNMKHSSDHGVAKAPQNDGRREFDWKLMIDPFIKGPGHTKVTRYGGTLSGPDEKPVVLKDPRFGMITRHKEVNLIVPKFKYDKWSVGTPPMKSIFIYGLNDNVNQDFLRSTFVSLGEIDQLKVYYHPKTQKHLGIAFVSFSKSNVTKGVLAKFHGTSIMGNIVSIKPDPLCQITKKVLDKLIKEGPNVNIPDIIQSVELRSNHKTAAYAFRHNERSLNYYTARGKTKRPSDHADRPKPATPSKAQARKQEAARIEAALRIEQVSPKMDTPPPTEISPIRPEEDELVKEQFESYKRSPDPIPDLNYKVPKKEPPLMTEKPDDARRDRRLYEMDMERRKSHSDRKYEEWKMRTEMEIRADKTNRYIKEHCGGSMPRDKYLDEMKYSKDKYLPSSKDYHHLSERDRYFLYYKYYREKERSSGDHQDSHRSSSKYDKYGKYYDRNLEYSSSSSNKRSSKEKLYKLSKSIKDYENSYHSSRDRIDCVSPSLTERRSGSRSRSIRDNEQYFVDRVSKRKRSKSPIYSTNSPKKPTPASPLKVKLETNGSAGSHDTGYNSISPPLPTTPKIDQDISQLAENPYGCGRAVPRKHISKVKVIGLKSKAPPDEMSSSSMSLDEESEADPKEVAVEDISPNNTPQPVPPPLLPLPTPHPIPLLPLPQILHPTHLIHPPIAAPIQYQTGQWLHNSYPNMYQYGYDQYNSEEAADILARRETEEKQAAKRKEERLNKERKYKSLNLLVLIMENILKKDVKIRLNETVAFTQLEGVWNQEEDKKKKEEEELAAKRREEMANSTDEISNKVPDMPSLSEMRNMSDAKQSVLYKQSYRQANLTFKVPKLNRGLRPQLQVVVKKMLIPERKQEESESEEEIDNVELVIKKRTSGNRYSTIYSSSSSSSESEEEEEEPIPEPKPKDEPAKVQPKYPARVEEEDLLILEQLLREELFEEDKTFYKMAYYKLLKESSELLHNITWLSPPEIPVVNRKRQSSADLKHSTGCARTEGFYKMSQQEKMALKLNRGTTDQPPDLGPGPKKGDVTKASARSTRAMQRRQATHYLTVPEVQYMQLTTRRKQVVFRRSEIHDWGLFALESIAADEMVIEYVGEVVREIIADLRERIYIEAGIGSSYMFRVDQTSTIVDATYRGSISRFINHNCDPNCYARVISVGTKKKIVIYSKRDIESEEEITYDYKFAVEEEAKKISCLCKSQFCRGFLN